MIVVDTNIITYRFIEGDKTDKAIKLQQYDPDWVVPFLWQHEFLNILSTLFSNKYISKEQCISIWKTVFNIFKERERTVEMEEALLISIKKQISAYDAQYIYLARSLKIQCFTEDKQLLKKFPGIAVSMKNVK